MVMALLIIVPNMIPYYMANEIRTGVYSSKPWNMALYSTFVTLIIMLYVSWMKMGQKSHYDEDIGTIWPIQTMVISSMVIWNHKYGKQMKQ